MTIETRPARPPGAPDTTAPAPLVVPPGSTTRGRARTDAPPRREGPAKLTGAALYADDLVFPGAWFGATIRSTEPRARLLAIDLDPAFDWSTVAVVTAADIPGDNVVAGIGEDQPILVPVGGEIRHQAEPVVLLAAADRSTLREARRRVRLRTEPLEPVFDPLASTVVFAHFELAKGDVATGLAEAEVVLEGTYRMGHQEQLYIENNAMIALPREDGGVTVHGSLQCPYYVHKALKRGLGLSAAQAQVVQAETGGGFGGKEEYPSMIGLHAALLARRTGRPVRMIYDRHEDLAATTKRHPAIVTHRTGVTRDGRIVAQDIELVMDGGAYTHADPGRAVARHDPCRRPVRRAARPDPQPRRDDQYPAERSVPRIRRPAERVRGRDPAEPGRRGDRDVAARDPPPQRLRAGRHHADAPGPARAALPGRRSSSAPRRRPSSSVAGPGPRAPAPRGRHASAPRAGSGWRSPGTVRGSPVPVRRRWARSSASS